MNKILWTICGLWLCGLLAAGGAETFSLANGSTVTGDIISFNDNGVIFRTGGDKYTDRMPWLKFSQAGLKQLAKNQKIVPFVAPFIIPAETQQAPQAEVKIQSVTRLDQSAPASLFGGLFASSVGLIMLLILYAANIYAGYEIALFRARPQGLLMGAAAVLPVIGPVVFLLMPSLRVTTPAAGAEETPAEGTSAGETPAEPAPHRFIVPGMAAETPATPSTSKEEIHIVSGSWESGTPPAPPENPQTEIFQRGQFMFNRRFFETKFAGFFGIVRREADKDKVLQVKSVHGLFTAERITRISANEVHFEVLRGGSRQEIMVPFSEIQEIQLKHKNA